MSSLLVILRIIANVFDHPVYGPVARKVAYAATKEILRAAYRRRQPVHSTGRVG